MRQLETWVATPLAGAIGWTLLHSLWVGAIIAAGLAASLMILRSSRRRYAAAWVALLLMVGSFGLTLVRMMPDGVRSLHNARMPHFAEWILPGMDVGDPSNPGLAAVVPWLAPFWIAGLSIVYLWQVAGWTSVCRMRQRGVCCPPEHWRTELARISARLRISRPVLLLESCLADAPMVLGHFRPLILMPIGLLAGLPAGQIQAVLLHELAHVRRHDYLMNILQRVIEGLLYYHPAVWWISHVIRAERENCCDDVVVSVSGNPHEYAAALAALAQNRWSREPALAATGGSLTRRVSRLLFPKAPNGSWTPLFVALLTVTAAIVAAQPQAAETPYVKWVNEDAVYIIADDERAAYLKLATDEEREKFIEQFWRRRDPTPGTAANEMKEEHYRRIAYSNDVFRTTDRTGWRTDRGRIYIVYGPPDEIEDRPREALQVWKYRHVQGVGDNLSLTFIDRNRTRDYRLLPRVTSP